MRWEWTVDGQVVSADLGLLTGRETIAVDGIPAFDKVSWKLRNEVPIELRSGRDATVTVSLQWMVIPRCVLEVDGVGIKPQVGRQWTKAPWWAWPFVVACLAIPFYTLGGALPTAIGFGGAALNWTVANREWHVAPRVVALTMITGFAWLLLAILLVGIDMLRSTG
jgi:hypothetical protein